MGLRVIIPVKPFADAKQRLAPALDPTERAQLAECMFRHVFDMASGYFGAPNVLVVSRSQDILAITEEEEAVGVPEDGTSDLNSALANAARLATMHGASRVLVLAGDLPLLGEDDLAQMATHTCAIAPDRHRRGTNALLWPVTLSFSFGDNSFARHRAIAENAAVSPQVIDRPGLAHDVDVPEDLIAILPRPGLAGGMG
jgi:2-phospho-L-lactate guanylyltransferase